MSIVFDQLFRATQEHMATLKQQNASGKGDDSTTGCLLGYTNYDVNCKRFE